MSGLGGTNLLDGGEGNDTLVSQGLNDTLIGGAGNDIFTIRSLGSATIIDDREDGGGDTVVVGQSTTDVGFAFRGNTLLVNSLSLGKPIAIVENFLGASFADATVSSFRFTDGQVLDAAAVYQRAMRTDEGDNWVTGTSWDELIDGGIGRDQLYGGGGRDTLVGGVGNDYLIGGVGGLRLLNSTRGSDGLNDGRDLPSVKLANGTVLTGADLYARRLSNVGTSGADTLWAYPGTYSLSGGKGNDLLNGSNWHDNLYGGLGNDTLRGAAGDDVLEGEKGNDTYLFNRGDGHDTIIDTDGTWFNSDLLKVGGATSKQLWFSKAGSNLDISVIGTDDKVTIQD